MAKTKKMSAKEMKARVEDVKEHWETIEMFIEEMEMNDDPTANESATMRKVREAMEKAYLAIEESEYADECVA